MAMDELYLLRGKCILTISIAFIMIIFGIEIGNFSNDNLDDEFNFYDVNIKDVASPNVSHKSVNLVNLYSSSEVEMEPINNSMEKKMVEPPVFWHLPVEVGSISSYPNYYHTAVDITSPRGINEIIYPVCNGVVSSIYTDSAGAKIVTVLHNVNGVYYTSMYVHLSSYAYNLYAGKEVTINDPLGRMGRTGVATGVHLHLEISDCNLYNDDKCRSLDQFFKYQKLRYNDGFKGIMSVINVSDSWNSR